jgi:hypothetical protein
VTAIGFVGPSEHRAGHADVLRAAGAWRVATSAAELSTHLHALAAEPVAVV